MASATITSESRSPAGSKTPESVSGCVSPARSGSPISDDACPICLGDINDKCAAESCFHNFCFLCLKEWAKQKPVCPLCKQPFTKILYKIKSESDYKEYTLPPQSSSNGFPVDMVEGLQILSNTARQIYGSFDLSSTIAHRSWGFEDYRRNRTVDQLFYQGFHLPTTAFQPRQRRRRRADRASSFFRLSIYMDDLWVQPIADITGQYRESSPDLYREQPALTHRLAPWVNREIAALMPSSRVSVLLVMIMDLIERYPINSREFRRALRPQLGNRTNHFVHEFYNFARSPYDMIGHDVAAQYVSRQELYDTVSDSGSATEDDDVIVVPIQASSTVHPPFDLTARPLHEEVVSSTVVPITINSSSNDYSSSESEQYKIVDSQKNNCKSNRVHNLNEPGPSGISSTASGSSSIKRERNSSDECKVLNILKPKRDRTPEVIDISTDEEVTRSRKRSKAVKNKNYLSKKTSTGKNKNKKKPKLDRTSFSVHFSGTLSCGPHNTSSGRVDHNYCSGSNSALQYYETDLDVDSDENYEPYRKQNKSKKRPLSKSCNKYNCHSTSNDKSTIRSQNCKRNRIVSSDTSEETSSEDKYPVRRKDPKTTTKIYKKTTASKKEKTSTHRTSSYNRQSEKRTKYVTKKTCRYSSSSSSLRYSSSSSSSSSRSSSSSKHLESDTVSYSSDETASSSNSSDSLSVSSLLKIPVTRIVSSESEDISNICKTINRYNRSRFKNKVITESSSSKDSSCSSSKSSSHRYPSKAKSKSDIKSSKNKKKVV